ncbi:unnamed protein product, partial [Staurois parvus]
AVLSLARCFYSLDFTSYNHGDSASVPPISAHQCSLSVPITAPSLAHIRDIYTDHQGTDQCPDDQCSLISATC